MVNADLNKKLAKHQKIDSDDIRGWLVVSNSFGHNWEKNNSILGKVWYL